MSKLTEPVLVECHFATYVDRVTIQRHYATTFVTDVVKKVPNNCIFFQADNLNGNNLYAYSHFVINCAFLLAPVSICNFVFKLIRAVL